jgi:hypothetical protein
MHHVRRQVSQEPGEPAECADVAGRRDRGLQHRRDDHVNAVVGGLTGQSAGAAGDDERLEGTAVKALEPAQRVRARAALQPGDDGSHGQLAGTARGARDIGRAH